MGYRPLSSSEIESRNRWLRESHDLFPAEYQDWIIRLVEDRNPRLRSTELSFGGATDYSESNVTTDRTYDANLTSLNEIADVLGTLLADLRAKGVIG